MDVAGRGSRTYIKVESLEPPAEGELDAIPLNQVSLTADGNNELDVKVVPDENDDEASQKGGGKCLDNCGCLQCILLVASVCIGVLSVVFDWLWVNDMAKSKKSLVFGPPGTGVLATLSIVASLGTITYLVETADKIKKYVTGKEWFDEESEELASLFLEEVPEITLNLLLSMCREVPTSYFQLIKAVLAMVSSGLRLLKGFCYLLGCKQDKKNKRRLRCSGWIILMIACLYTFAASICVFIFIYQPPDGDKNFHVPKSVIGKHYNTERHFRKSGVFFSHPSFDHCDHSNYPTPHRTGITHKNWFQVDSIYSFLSLGKGQLEAGYAYNNSTGTFWVKSKLAEDCYTVTFQDCSIVRVNASNCDLMPDASLLFFTFIQMPKSKTLVFGDIQFNATMMSDSRCMFLSSNGYGQLYNNDQYNGQLHYFKADFTVDTELPVTFTRTRPRFYQYPQDLTNVTEAWKTGYRKCPMSGSIGPNRNGDIYRNCLYRFGQHTEGGGGLQNGL